MTYHQTIMEHEAMARQQGMEQGVKQGIKQGIEKGIKQGIEKGIEKGIAQAKLETLKAMMKNLKLSAEEAMAASDISKEDYAKYKNLLQTV